MIIIWRGWGFIVLLFGFAAAALAAGIVERGGIHTASTIALVDVAASALGGSASGRSRTESTASRVAFSSIRRLGEFTFRPSAGSLFFVKTRYWPYIMVAIGALFAIQRLLNL